MKHVALGATVLVCGALWAQWALGDATGRKGQWVDWRTHPDYQQQQKALEAPPGGGDVQLSVVTGVEQAVEVFRGELHALSRAADNTLGPLFWPSRSVGDPNHGYQSNPVWLTERSGIYLRTRAAWGTRETVQAVRKAADEMMALYPEGPDLVVTEISKYRGRRIKPHRSHQTGRDVDILLYFEPAGEGLRGPMDPEKTWALINALIRNGPIEVGILDYRQQGRIYRYARDELQIPESELEGIFAYPKGRRHKDALFVHAPGHRTHLHIRYLSPRAMENADRYEAAKGYQLFQYVTEGGETQRSLARSFGTTVKLIAEANGFEPDPKADLPKWRLLWIRVPYEASSAPCQEFEREMWKVNEVYSK
ncbi:MAG: penicillin-insensitive murein endopeptidase [Bradymonadia bacterium]